MRPISSDFHCFLLAGLRRGGIVQNLELRLQDLQALPPEVALLHSAVERQRHAGLKPIFEISGVEPDAL